MNEELRIALLETRLNNLLNRLSQVEINQSETTRLIADIQQVITGVQINLRLVVDFLKESYGPLPE